MCGPECQVVLQSSNGTNAELDYTQEGYGTWLERR